MNKIIGTLMGIATAGVAYLDVTHLEGTTSVVQGFMVLFNLIGTGAAIYIFRKDE